MKKCIALLTVLFFLVNAAPFSASALAKNKKASTHKHRDENCCCDMKNSKSDKKNDCSKMDSEKVDNKKDSQAK
jgi:hypothetical protein